MAVAKNIHKEWKFVMRLTKTHLDRDLDPRDIISALRLGTERIESNHKRSLLISGLALACGVFLALAYSLIRR